MDAERIRRGFKEKGMRVACLRSESKLVDLPENPAKAIDAYEKQITSWPDEMPEKPVLLRHVRRARSVLHKGDKGELQFCLWRIWNYYHDAAPLTSSEAAERIGVTTGTLCRWRKRETGPTWIKIGRSIRYLPDAVDGWIADEHARQNTVFKSTVIKAR